MSIEDGLGLLVTALDDLPGVHTLVSNAAGPAAPGNGEASHEVDWLVMFRVDPLEGGWLSLQGVAWAVLETEHSDSIALGLFLTGDTPDTMAFNLRGWGESDPEDLANVIYAMGWPPTGQNDEDEDEEDTALEDDD